MKTLTTKDNVLATAKALIGANGSTTTLDVKNKLRMDGHFVKQAEVSTFMRELNDDGELEYTDNGQYRTYTLPQADDSGSSGLLQLPGATANQAPTSAPGPKSSRAKVFITPLCDDANKLTRKDLEARFQPSDWVVYSAKKGAPLYIISGVETRDHVRTYFARTEGIPIKDVRACKLGNFWVKKKV